MQLSLLNRGHVRNMPIRILAAMFLLLPLCACQAHRNEFQFCEVNQGVFDREPTVVDLERGFVRGQDVLVSAKRVRSEFAAGFVEPFPLVLPTVPLTQLPPQWELEDYRFTVSSPRSGPSGWILINGDPSRPETGKARSRSSVLYSPTKGVIAVQRSFQTPDRTITIDQVFCGTGVLQGSSFR